MKNATRFRYFAGFLLGGILLLAIPAEAQVKRLDCAPPRGVSRSSEVASLIASAEEDCSRGSHMLDEAKDWRSTADDLRKQADRFRKESAGLRKDGSKLRDQVSDFRDHMADLQKESGTIEKEREDLDREIAISDQVAGAFRGSSDSTVTVPLLGSGRWEEGEDRYARARIRYYDVRLSGIDDEIMTFEGRIQVNEELAADKEAAAVDLDQLALNNERASLEADVSSSLAEEAALLAESLAVKRNLQACTQFIALNLNDSDAKRNVGRAVKYIEKFSLLLTGLDAEEADRIVGEAKVRFDL